MNVFARGSSGACGLLLAGVLLTGCGGEGNPDVIDPDVIDDVDADDTSGDTSGPDEFDIRVPDQESLKCESDWEDYFLAQVDHLCRIDNDEMVADLYIQSSPTDCGEWGNPTYETDNVWLRIDGDITSTTGEYEFGGRHHNDMISFLHEGSWHRLWHSSIGWGWRACTRPDCLVICEPDVDCVVDSTEGVAVDGCLRDAGDPPPALQVICVQVNADGTLPPFEDPWNTPDPYAQNGEMILPCLGEESLEL